MSFKSVTDIKDKKQLTFPLNVQCVYQITAYLDLVLWHASHKPIFAVQIRFVLLRVQLRYFLLVKSTNHLKQKSHLTRLNINEKPKFFCKFMVRCLTRSLKVLKVQLNKQYITRNTILQQVQFRGIQNKFNRSIFKIDLIRISMYFQCQVTFVK